MPRVFRVACFAPLMSYNNQIQPSPLSQPRNFHTSALTKNTVQTSTNGSIANETAAITSKQFASGFTTTDTSSDSGATSPIPKEHAASQALTADATQSFIKRSPTPIHRTIEIPVATTRLYTHQQQFQQTRPPAVTEATIVIPQVAPTDRIATEFAAEGPQPRTCANEKTPNTNRALSLSSATRIRGSIEEDGESGSNRNENCLSRNPLGKVGMVSSRHIRRPVLRGNTEAATEVDKVTEVGAANENSSILNTGEATASRGTSVSTSLEETLGGARVVGANSEQTISANDKGSGAPLSVKALPVIAAAPRRVGPIFPETINVARTKTDTLVVGIPGLEYLASIDQLNVKNKILILKSIAGCETAHGGFAVRNLLGQRVFGVEENTDCFISTCLCTFPKHPLNLTVRDSHRREVLRLSRPDRGVCCCFPCCLQVVNVISPLWGELGSVHHEWSLSNPHLAIKNSEGKTQFRIVGPVCTCSKCQKEDFIIFPVTSEETGQQVGRISCPFPRRLTPDADQGSQQQSYSHDLVEDPAGTKNAHQQTKIKEMEPASAAFEEGYSVSFSKELPVSMKAVLLAAVFLIDFLYNDLKATKVKNK